MKTDSQLYMEIMDKLEFEPAINPTNITLAIHNKIVTLAGKVSDYAQKKTIERAIRGIKGVQGIVNNLEVNLEDNLKRNDNDIAQAVLHALKWDVNVPANHIKITVEKGRVKLTGQVAWWYQRKSAEKALQSLAGITGIDNQIKITPTAPLISSNKVTEKIIKEFQRNAIIDAKAISVDTIDGKIILHGQVHSWAEYNEANRAAWSIPGIVEVDNQLTVTRLYEN